MRRLHTIQLRHGIVHHDHLRSQLTRQFHRLTTVSRFANYFDVRLVFEQSSEAAPYQSVVIHQKNGNHSVVGTSSFYQCTACWNRPNRESCHASAPRAHAWRSVRDPCRVSADANAIVLDREPQPMLIEIEANLDQRRFRVLCDVVQCFLRDAVNVDTTAFGKSAGTFPLVVDRNAGLLLPGLQQTFERDLNAVVIEDRGVQRLGEAARFFQRFLNYVFDFGDIASAEHQADCREDLPEVVMQFSCDRFEDFLLNADQPLRSVLRCSDSAVILSISR